MFSHLDATLDKKVSEAFRKKVDLTSVERVLQKGSNSNVLLFLLLHKVVFEHFLIVFYFYFKEIDHVVFEKTVHPFIVYWTGYC